MFINTATIYKSGSVASFLYHFFSVFGNQCKIVLVLIPLDLLSVIQVLSSKGNILNVVAISSYIYFVTSDGLFQILCSNNSEQHKEM